MKNLFVINVLLNAIIVPIQGKPFYHIQWYMTGYNMIHYICKYITFRAGIDQARKTVKRYVARTYEQQHTI